MPETLTPAAALLAGIVEHPRDWDRMLVYADWLDEHGDPAEALGWRLLAGERRWPHVTQKSVPVGKLWWLNDDAERRPDNLVASRLPDPVFRLLAFAGWKGNVIAQYDALPAALADAARAFGLAWLAGWRPKGESDG